MVAFEERDSGVFVVRYDDRGDLEPSRQASLLSAMRLAALTRAPAVVFLVGPQVRTVDVTVPTFWLETTSEPALRLAALAVASPNMAVRVAAAGFGAANALRGLRFPVKAFSDAAPAIAWAAEQVRAAVLRAAGLPAGAQRGT